MVVKDITAEQYPGPSHILLYATKILRIGKKDDSAKGYKGFGSQYSTHKLQSEVTGNCQMSIMSNVQGFLGYGKAKWSKEENASILEQISEFCTTNAMLVDIPENCLKTLEEAIADNHFEIIFSTPYTNLTGSPMVIVYIQFREHPEDPDDEYDEYEDDDEYYDDLYEEEDDEDGDVFDN